MQKPQIEIDGERFSTLEEFFEHFQEQALEGVSWGKNLDAFNDVLRGGFGTPDGGFVLRWKNHQISKQRLGFGETERQLTKRLRVCYPMNTEAVQEQLASAQQHIGSTVFEWLLEIIAIHGSGGEEEEDGVELVLQ
jgi:RNAse (barnase) inhibitor barstar